MLRRNLLKIIPVFLSGLILGKKVSAKVEISEGTDDYEDCPGAWVRFTKKVVQEAGEGVPGAKEVIKTAFDTNRKGFYEKHNISQNEK